MQNLSQRTVPPMRNSGFAYYYYYYWVIKKLRLLYGREFTVYSDNVTAVSLLRKRDLASKFACWVMDLAEYDFQSLHCTGPSTYLRTHFPNPLQLPFFSIHPTLK